MAKQQEVASKSPLLIMLYKLVLIFNNLYIIITI